MSCEIEIARVQRSAGGSREDALAFRSPSRDSAGSTRRRGFVTTSSPERVAGGRGGLARAAAGVALFGGLCLTSAAHAEAPLGSKRLAPARQTADASLLAEGSAWERRLHGALGLPDWLDLAVEQRTRFELLEGPFRPGEPERQTQLPLRTRVRLGLDASDALRFLVEVQDSRVAGADPRDFKGSQVDRVDVLQLFASATSHDLLGSGFRGHIHVGRLTLDLGSRRLLSRSRFGNTTTAFDGVHLQLAAPEGTRRARAFATRPVAIERGTFDDVSRSARRLWGLAYEDRRLSWLQLDLAVLGLHDRVAGRDLYTAAARFRRPPERGRLDHEMEAWLQLGEREGRDQEAFGGTLGLGYTLAAPWSPRVLAQLDYASGTADPEGSRSRTFDPLFGSRRGDLVLTGIFGPFRRSNLLSAGVALTLAPRPNLALQLKVRRRELAQARDVFAGTGLQDATGAAGRRLGWDTELAAQWSPRPWLSLDVGYARWFKGSYLARVPGSPSSRDADYFYLATQLRF